MEEETFGTPRPTHETRDFAIGRRQQEKEEWQQKMDELRKKRAAMQQTRR
jgi:hypothetical protein